jgi:hypothetical protein
VVLVAAVVLLAVRFWPEVDTTASLRTRTFQSDYRNNLEQFECLTTMLHHEVPEHASFYIESTGFDAQRLAELAVDWAYPAARQVAAWDLSLDPGPCLGQGVKAERA